MALFFADFTISMLTTSFNMIRNNTSTIDNKKGKSEFIAQLAFKIPEAVAKPLTFKQKLN